MPSLFAQAMNPANAIRPAPAPHSYGRPVTEADVQAAQFQNYLKAPAPVQKLLQHYSPDSDGYARIQNAQASAAADLAARPGVRQIGTDGQVHDFAAPAPSQAQLAEATLARVPRAMELLNPAVGQGLGQGLAPRPHVAQQPTASPVTVGEVNGVRMAVPTAGNYTNGRFASAMEQLNPAFLADANDGISMDRVNGAQEAQQYLAAGLPLPEHLRHLNPNLGLSSDIQQKQDLRAQRKAEKTEAFQLDLADRNHPGYGRGGRKSGDTVGEAGEKDGRKAYLRDHSGWVQDTRKAKGVQARLKAKLNSPDADPTLDTIKVAGIGEMTLAEAQEWSEGVLADPGPQESDYYTADAADGKSRQSRPWFSGGGSKSPSKPAAVPAQASKGKPDTSSFHPNVSRDLDRVPAESLDAAIAYAEDPQNGRPPAEGQYLRWRKSQFQSRSLAQR